MESEEIKADKITKSGNVNVVNLRDRLFSLSLESYHEDAVILRYLGSCRNDGTLLQPDQVVYMLQQIGGEDLQLLKVHRQQLILHSKE
jgi:uncharacterized protein (DUF2344 family)